MQSNEWNVFWQPGNSSDRLFLSAFEKKQACSNKCKMEQLHLSRLDLQTRKWWWQMAKLSKRWLQMSNFLSNLAALVSFHYWTTLYRRGIRLSHVGPCVNSTTSTESCPENCQTAERDGPICASNGNVYRSTCEMKRLTCGFVKMKQ